MREGLRREGVLRRAARWWVAVVILVLPGSSAGVSARSQGEGVTPTFARDIAPILFQHCVSCHNPGINSPFSLLTYEDVRPLAARIRFVTERRTMPPWKPEPGYGAFVGARRLTDDEVARIARWVDAGAPRGAREDLPPAPAWTDGWKLGAPDVVLRMPVAYRLAADGPDVFRNVVLPIPLAATGYVKAVEFAAGSKAVHHANMRIDETRTSRRLDEADPEPGYDGLIARTAKYPEGHFFGWTPGQLPPVSEATAWRVNPSSDMVVQLHLRPTGKPEDVQVAIGLHLTAERPRLRPAMLRLGKQDIDIAPDETDHVITDSYVLPVDVEVHAVQPHAHYRAREVQGFATLPDGRRRWLIYIRDWDFDWQDQYRYASPLVLPKGTTLTMRYTYDNSSGNRRNPQLPPARVHWGQNSTDEMGDLWIQVVPRSPADLANLTEAFRLKVFREDIVGYETMLRSNPDDTALHDDLALLYLETGRPSDAIAHFAASARAQPSLPAAQYNLGVAFTAAGQLDAARASYERALEIDPAHAGAHNNLGSLLLAGGQIDDAVGHFKRALALNPDHPQALVNLGGARVRQGEHHLAVEHLRRALDLTPDNPDAHYNIARAWLGQHRAKEALQHYRRALALRPEWVPALIECAWVLAAHPDEALRSPLEAIEMADRAVARTSRADARALDALAAAQAAAGRFDLAAATARDALAVFALDDPAALAQDLRERLALYESERPYVDTPGSQLVR